MRKMETGRDILILLLSFREDVFLTTLQLDELQSNYIYYLFYLLL